MLMSLPSTNLSILLMNNLVTFEKPLASPSKIISFLAEGVEATGRLYEFFE